MEKKLLSRFHNSLVDSDPEFLEIIEDFSLEEVPSVGKLTDKERMLCILSVLLGVRGLGEFEHMVHVALDMGIDPIVIKEVIYQATAYLGIGRTYDYLIKTNEVMREHGIKLLLPGQSTTNRETRFEAGLNKQVELFGEAMRDRQKDSGLRKNINRWLADNCFGDYYTRKGLNDQEREMITFCFILSQGGCENQLRGHTQGNLNVGNDKEKLYQVVEQCMPYIGYPRSLNALSIIDEVAGK